MKKQILLGLLSIKGVGRKTIKDFLNNIDKGLDEEKIFLEWNKYINNIRRVEKITFQEFKNKIIKAEMIFSESENIGIKAITILDEEYPKELKNISDSPVIIYAKGNIELLKQNKNIAIIGTRKATKHGEKVAERLGGIFAQSGYCIVSGLALGCDMYGHMGCLKVGGNTIAVLSTPLDIIVPVSNKMLADKIIQNNGLLISEYYIGQETTKGFYVERNRLQSALSRAVIVVETDKTGGTMHTVKFAREQGKIVACYKHPDKYNDIEQTRGNQELVKEENVHIIQTTQDIESLKSMIDVFSDCQTISNVEEQMSIL